MIGRTAILFGSGEYRVRPGVRSIRLRDSNGETMPLSSLLVELSLTSFDSEVIEDIAPTSVAESAAGEVVSSRLTLEENPVEAVL